MPAHNDVSPGDIINVTGHKDQSSLAPYIASSSNKKRKAMSEILHSYGKNVEVSSSIQSCTTTNLKLSKEGTLSLFENAHIEGGTINITMHKD